jgi:DNA-binding NarL/FixJ family response regulator
MRENSGFQTSSGQPARIIIADADENARGMLKPSLIQRLGAWIYEAKSGEELAAMLDETRVDLVITNANLSGKSGLSTLAYDRARGGQVPFIVLTSSSDRWFRAFVNRPDGSIEDSCTVSTEALSLLAARLVGREPLPSASGSWDAMTG